MILLFNLKLLNYKDLKVLNYKDLKILIFTNIIAGLGLIYDSIFIAFFKILTTFKDGQTIKEGQNRLSGLIRLASIKLENGSRKLSSFLASGFMMPLSYKTLDYTSDTFRWFIWGGNVHRVLVMAILWLKKLSRQFPNILITLIILHLQDIMLFKKHWGRFGDLCLALNKAGNR